MIHRGKTRNTTTACGCYMRRCISAQLSLSQCLPLSLSLIFIPFPPDRPLRMATWSDKVVLSVVTPKVFLDFYLDKGCGESGVVTPVIQPGFLSYRPENVHSARYSVYAILSRYLNGK